MKSRSIGSCKSYEAESYLYYKVTPQPATSISITADPDHSSAPGTVVTFTAAAAGGAGDYEYQFWLYGPATNNTWQMVQDYSALSTWAWQTSTTDLCSNTVKVNTRSKGSCDTYETSQYLDYKVSPPAATGVALTALPETTTTAGTPVTFTASGQGGAGEYEYCFYRYGPSTGYKWEMVRDYAIGNTWTWTPGLADVSDNKVKVDVRSLGSCASSEAYKYISYQVTTPPDTQLPPTVSVSATPQQINVGESGQLSWSTGNATTVTIDNGIGAVAASGTVAVKPLETTIYTVTAVNAQGTTTAQTSVIVNYPIPTVNCSATPSSINIGEQAALSWNTAYAEQVSIRPNIGAVAHSGSISVQPDRTTTYYVVVSNRKRSLPECRQASRKPVRISMYTKTPTSTV